MRHFEHLAEMNLRMLPPSRIGLIQQIKRACLQGGYLWRETVHNVIAQDVTQWGWKMINGKFVPEWQPNDAEVDALSVCKVCTCKKAICKKCKCVKEGLKCIHFRKCQRKCPNI